jgi:hypothetical protein
MQKTTTILTTLAALAALTGSAIAQTPPPPPPVHHGLFGKLFHPHAKPGQPAAGNFGRPGTYPGHPGTTMGHMNGYAGHHGMGSMTSMGGGFIGNKNSHVYHMPGDKGAMPSAQNRVYFPTAAAAEAAGYRRAGSKSGMMGPPPNDARVAQARDDGPSWDGQFHTLSRCPPVRNSGARDRNPPFCYTPIAPVRGRIS